MKERMKDGIYYRGVQMYDAGGHALVNVEWGSGGKWTDLVEIPED